MTETPAFGDYNPHGSTEAPQAAAPAPAVRKLSLLEEIRQDAKKSLQRIISYPVNTRPGYEVAFDANIERDDVERWQRNAMGKKKRAEDLNALQLAGQCLLESNVGIFKNGRRVADETGDDLLLNSNEWIEVWGGPSILALRNFMGDGLVQTMGLNLLREAGYGDGSELYAEEGTPDENPTRR